MLKRILIIVALCAVVAAGTVGYMYLKPTATASGPIEAIPLAQQTSQPAAATDEPSEPAESEESVQAATTTVTETVAGSETEAETAEEATAATETTLFEIVSAESEVRFVIDEVLNGTPTTVVGATDQVAGQIAIDLAALDQIQIGVIQINARTLTTDNDMRNRAISNRILFTDDYEYITFTPTAITGLPTTINLGESIALQIDGELTVRDVTQPISFTAQVTPVSETRLEGVATATIRYADFDISIPQVPSVTGVEDEVLLEIDFAAVQV